MCNSRTSNTQPDVSEASLIIQKAKSASSSTSTIKDNKIRWRYAFNDFIVVVKEFFLGPKKDRKLDIDPLSSASSLLDANPNDEKTIQIIERLVNIHRHTENTKARRRLEKWSTRVIAIYLLVIGLLIVFAYQEHPCISYSIKIPTPIMEFLLTTTTINIIGLVVIVLKGHFQEKE
ncbi:MAG: hypothetical protein KBT27_11455 [Prevotellaceae bacterium]|nr:hypothetical protein [Candidatus Faecinaster equi]